MKKHFVLLIAMGCLGGLATANIHNDHSPTIGNEVKKDALKQFDAPTFNITVVAEMDHTSPEVIRPKTAFLVIDHGDAALPKVVAPIIPVAHGPPNA